MQPSTLHDVDLAFNAWYNAVQNRSRYAIIDANNALQAEIKNYHQGDLNLKKKIEEYIEKKKEKAFA